MSAVTTTDLKGALPLLARGKVRDVYTLNGEELLFVATDRISAYDVIMQNVCATNPTGLDPYREHLIYSEMILTKNDFVTLFRESHQKESC